MSEKSFITEKKDLNWFKNFWYYYKFHTIFGVIALAFIIFALRDCAMQVTPDLNVSIISPTSISAQTDSSIEQDFASSINDINSDGKTNVNVISQVISQDQAQLAIATHQAIMLEITKGEYYLYFLNDYYFDLYCQGNILCDLSQYSDLPANTYSITVQDNEYFKDLTNINTNENIHLCVRKVTSSVKEKHISKAHSEMLNALEIFKKFYK